MLTSLAWKNIWRSPKRSGIIIMAISFGLWGGLIAGAIMMGWGESMVSTAIDRDLAHVQLHQQGFTVNHEVNDYIPDAQKIITDIRSLPNVSAVSGRTIVEAMAASPTSTFGVQIDGIDPTQSVQVTNIDKLIKEGSYLTSDDKNRAVIGEKLADRLNLKLNSKIVLSFQALDSSMISAAFRVVGIYKSQSVTFDESHVFINQTDLTRLLGGPTVIHEIVVRAKESELTPILYNRLNSEYPNLDIETWQEIAPEIAATVSAMSYWSYIFVGIIILALTFGITNTMLMAVMERRQELGILIGVGMNRLRVFGMIMLETIMLSFTGGVGGLILGVGTIKILSHTGIDFSSFAASLENFGAASVLYPFLPLTMYIALAVMLLTAALFGAAFPAMKAVHLKPSEAIRS